MSERNRLRIEAALLVGLLFALFRPLIATSDAKGLALLAVSAAVAFVILAVVRIVNTWGTPKSKRWVLAMAALGVVSLYVLAYAGMLRRGLLVTQVRVRPGGIIDLHYESDWVYCWGDFEHPAKWQQAWRTLFWPAFTTDRLLGIRAGINDKVSTPERNPTLDPRWQNIDPPFRPTNSKRVPDVPTARQRQ